MLFQTENKKAKRRIFSLGGGKQSKTLESKKRKTKSQVVWGCKSGSQKRSFKIKATNPNITPFKVYIRIRPLNQKEKDSRQEGMREQVVKKVNNKIIVFSANTQYDLHRRYRQYILDEVFSQKTSNHEIFHSEFSSLIDNVIKGFNSTIFAYGLTGTGKTYTMFGNIYNQRETGFNPGLIFLTIQDLLQKIS